MCVCVCVMMISVSLDPVVLWMVAIVVFCPGVVYILGIENEQQHAHETMYLLSCTRPLSRARRPYVWLELSLTL